MIQRRQIWFRGAVAVAAVWVIALGGIWLVRAQRMTAEKTLAYMNALHLADLSAAQRKQAIEGLADRVNRLSFEERQKVRFEKSIRETFDEMTEEERARYLDLTLPKGMQQMMEAFNQMTPAKRKQLVSRAINDMNRMRDETNQQDLVKSLSDQSVQRIIDEGMKNYIRDASADSKLDLQPMIEQMQNIMQMAR